MTSPHIPVVAAMPFGNAWNSDNLPTAVVALSHSGPQLRLASEQGASLREAPPEQSSLPTVQSALVPELVESHDSEVQQEGNAATGGPRPRLIHGEVHLSGPVPPTTPPQDMRNARPTEEIPSPLSCCTVS